MITINAINFQTETLPSIQSIIKEKYDFNSTSIDWKTATIIAHEINLPYTSKRELIAIRKIFNDLYKADRFKFKRTASGRFIAVPPAFKIVGH